MAVLTPGTSPAARIAPTPRSVVASNRRRRRVRAATGAFNMAAVAVAAVFAFPIYWMINTSFKSADEYETFTPHFVPTSPTLSNYTTSTHVLNFWSDVRNSLIFTAVAVSISLVIGFFGALAIARFRFTGRRALIFVVMIVQMLPLAVMILPMYKILADVHKTDSLTGVIIIYIGLILPYTVWTLRGFIVNVPRELDEAALVDGCSRFQTFYRIILPLVGPGLVATSVYGFIQIWNEWLVISTINSGDATKHNLMTWLTDQTTLRGTAWGPLMAGAVMSSVPVVVLFLIIQKHIATGLTAGAVKG
jgi:N,N'-diacetylchitobiose transport system permease protein